MVWEVWWTVKRGRRGQVGGGKGESGVMGIYGGVYFFLDGETVSIGVQMVGLEEENTHFIIWKVVCLKTVRDVGLLRSCSY